MLIRWVEDYKARPGEVVAGREGGKGFACAIEQIAYRSRSQPSLGKALLLRSGELGQRHTDAGPGQRLRSQTIGREGIGEALRQCKAWLNLGDGWWSLHRKMLLTRKRRCCSLVRHFGTDPALPGLSGLLQVKVEKRLGEIGTACQRCRKKNGDLLASVGGFYGQPIAESSADCARGRRRHARIGVAVQAALIWLANHQMPNGSWSLQQLRESLHRQNLHRRRRRFGRCRRDGDGPPALPCRRANAQVQRPLQGAYPQRPSTGSSAISSPTATWPRARSR